ncbi:MAG TPA: FtsK/SpoIIIE domain-containing protein, partial [Planctomycetaceae bacterium]|nr:FtsK/SpoIIIE domain-containing protein [Planctomycetaceae bacterium]
GTELPPAERIGKFSDAAQAIQQFSELEELARNSFERLESQGFAHLCSGRRLLTMILLGAGALFGGAWFLLDRTALGFGQMSPEMWLAILGGAAVLVPLVIGLLCWDTSRRQTRDAFEAFHRAKSLAQQCYDSWERLAQKELDKADDAFSNLYQKLVVHRERSLEKFAEDRASALEEVIAERDSLLERATGERAEKTEPLRAAHEREISRLEAQHALWLQQLETHHQTEVANLRNEFRERQEIHQSRLNNLHESLLGEWTNRLRHVTEISQQLHQASIPAEPWNKLTIHQSSAPENLPTEIPLGTFGTSLAFLEGGVSEAPEFAELPTDWTFPAVLSFPDAPTLILNYDSKGRQTAERILQVAMLRFLTRIPPGSVRFTVLDPVGLGEPFSSFMHLTDQNELLITHRIWTEPAQIDKQLADLTEHLENIFQKYLRNEFESIEEYNEYAGEVAEPYRVLVVSGFPTSFSERAAQRLANIAASGPRCGVYLLIARDTAKPLPRDFDLASLADNALVLDWNQDHFETNSFGEPLFVLAPDDPPEPQLFSDIVKQVGELSTTVRRVEVPFRRIAPGVEALWTTDSRKQLDLPLGRSGATRLQHLKLGLGTSQHVLVAGRTGSGKSTLLHIIITNAAMRYSPDDLELYLIDFKKGVEFKTYASHHLPHARVIAIESDREFGVSALQKLDETLKERGDLFREAGVQDVESWRNARPDHPMPRILLIIDEFQEFFTEDDRIAQTASLLLDRLVRQGRAFGVHVLLGSQTLGGAYSLARSTLSQMAVRIALQCSESDAHLILSEENSAARLLTRPGEAIYNDANGTIEGNSPFQIAWLDDEEREQCLAQILHEAEARGEDSYACTVFEGNIPADQSFNPEILRIPETVGANAAASRSLKFWLGDPVTISRPSAISLERQPGQNVLIVGQEMSAVEGIVSTALVSLANQKLSPVEIATTVILDGDAKGDSLSPCWQEIVDRLPGPISWANPANVEDRLKELSAELDRRKDDPAANPPAICVFVLDVSQFRQLKKSDDDFGFGGFDKEKTVSSSKRFGDLLREGPASGIHFVVWANSYNNVDRWLGRPMLKEFEYRIAFQMSGTDSSNLIESPAANRLGVNRAVLYRDDVGSTEKFRPYGPPSDVWLEQIERHFSQEQTNLEAADDLGDFQIL